ncbi:high mobility group protein B2a [Brachionichthys hirsutus]|uniref:high mobility group protein B2a n=1 Tax=Brachionichthys hirsutus TaxID=412623 RepID=UPI003604F138
MKDRSKPKGKTSSYAYFVATCREEHKKKHPGVPVGFAAFSKKCSERWKTMSQREKVKFEDMAKSDKVRYEEEMKGYIPPMGVKTKKKKDPNAPKRPPSAFFVFCSEHRPKIKEEYPGSSIGDTAKKLGELWSTQSANDKAPYNAKAAKLKEKYEKDVASYKAKCGPGKSDAGKKGGPGRPAPKSAEQQDDDDDDEDEDDEDEDDDEDDDDD